MADYTHLKQAINQANKTWLYPAGFPATCVGTYQVLAKQSTSESELCPKKHGLSHHITSP